MTFLPRFSFSFCFMYNSLRGQLIFLYFRTIHFLLFGKCIRTVYFLVQKFLNCASLFLFFLKEPRRKRNSLGNDNLPLFFFRLWGIGSLIGGLFLIFTFLDKIFWVGCEQARFFVFGVSHIRRTAVLFRWPDCGFPLSFKQYLVSPLKVVPSDLIPAISEDSLRYVLRAESGEDKTVFGFCHFRLRYFCLQKHKAFFSMWRD